MENERRQRQCGQRRPREGHETGLQRERGTIAEIVGLEGNAKLGEGSPKLKAFRAWGGMRRAEKSRSSGRPRETLETSTFAMLRYHRLSLSPSESDKEMVSLGVGNGYQNSGA